MTLEDIDAILQDSTRFSAFDLIDAILEGSSSRTNRILMSLKNEGVEPLLILWSMTREVRAISHLCFELAKGLPLTKVLDNANLWKHKKELMLRYFKRFTLPIPELQKQLQQSLIQAKHIDDIIKGRTSGNAWHAISFLCCMMMFVSGVQYA
jgi:DNA polymerase-3 subunit delta